LLWRLVRGEAPAAFCHQLPLFPGAVSARTGRRTCTLLTSQPHEPFGEPPSSGAPPDGFLLLVEAGARAKKIAHALPICLERTDAWFPQYLAPHLKGGGPGVETRCGRMPPPPLAPRSARRPLRLRVSLCGIRRHGPAGALTPSSCSISSRRAGGAGGSKPGQPHRCGPLSAHSTICPGAVFLETEAKNKKVRTRSSRVVLHAASMNHSAPDCGAVLDLALNKPLKKKKKKRKNPTTRRRKR